MRAYVAYFGISGNNPLHELHVSLLCALWRIYMFVHHARSCTACMCAFAHFWNILWVTESWMGYLICMRAYVWVCYARVCTVQYACVNSNFSDGFVRNFVETLISWQAHDWHGLET
jgi:hypothetical protein